LTPAKGLYFLAILFMFGFTGMHVFGQVPEKPDLIRVTVDPETGHDWVYWKPSPSLNVDFYVVGRAVWPNPQEPESYIEVARTANSATSAEITNTSSGSESVAYTVWAVDTVGTLEYLSLFDKPPDSTMFLHAVFDSCQSSITLTWNDYNTWRGSIQNYTVYQWIGTGLYNALAVLPEGVNTWTFQPVNENMTYSLFVEVTANHEDSILHSISNRVNPFTRMSVVPDSIYADFATLGENNTVDLSFSIDPASELQNYKLLRSASRGGPRDTIAAFKTPGKTIVYQDKISFTSGVYYYRLMALNNCGKEVVVSNPACNVLLGGQNQNLLIALSWNDYFDWTGGVDHYSVYRTIGDGGIPAEEMNAGKDTFYMDDFSTRINYSDPQSTRVCYQVAAYEADDAGMAQNISRSNHLCFALDPDVRMPNAFIPNNHDGVNDIFGPLFSFVPERYTLTIYNRAGLKIWEGSEPWDGTVKGKPVPEEVYMYHLKLFNYESADRELAGQVTVVYR
jgi:gliding motility-associated-like protein